MPNIGSSGIVGRGDLQFISKKEFDGKIRSAEGALSAVGDLATLTANTGKDMYLARAKITFWGNTFTGDLGNKVELKVNGTTIETTAFSVSVNTGGGGGALQSMVYEFKNIGHKVLAGEIIKLEVTVLGTKTDVEGFIECYEEDTGVSPDA
jgi:hypothetical protein